MNTQDLIQKLSGDDKLSEDEQKELALALQKEMDSLQKNDPAKYLELLKVLNETIEEINSALTSE